MIGGQDPLAALRPLYPPPPIDWWPPAPGWWTLACVLLAVPGLILWYRRRTALRRAALAELRRLENAGLDDTRLSAGINQLLRRVALTCFPRSPVAAMSGEEWLQFLDSEARTKGFLGGPGRVLVTAPFDPAATLDRRALIELARQWIQANSRRRR